MPAPALSTRRPAIEQVVGADPQADLPVLSEEQIRAMRESEYMNELQMNFFRQRLLDTREEVLVRQVAILEQLNEHDVSADPADRATAEEEHTLALRLQERESMLLRKIDESLRRIRNKEYGYCEKTGEPIGIPRLLARPTATVCIQVKDRDEKVELRFKGR